MKSQVSIEFLILVSVLIFLAGATFLTTGTFHSNVFEEKVYASAKEICRAISSEINTAVKIGNGYEREFFIDEKLFGNLDYSVEIKDYSVKVKWENKFVSCNCLASSVNGNIKPGKNLIRNEGGEIYVE